jgi:hypothetical protein
MKQKTGLPTVTVKIPPLFRIRLRMAYWLVVLARKLIGVYPPPPALDINIYLNEDQMRQLNAEMMDHVTPQ